MAVVCLVVALGCSGRSDVVITGIEAHHTPAGIIKQPADLSTFQVLVYAGDEQLPAVPVRGDASGLLTIKGVPDGPVVVEVASQGGRWWWASESHDIEWTWKYAGRLDARPAEVMQPVMLAVDGLSAWTSRDSLVATSFETTTELSPTLQPDLAVGSTSIAATFDWNDSHAWSANATGRPYLMDEGDQLTLARRRVRYDSQGRTIWNLTQILDVVSPRQESGAPVTIAGAMMDAEPNATSRFSVDHPAFSDITGAAASSISWDMYVYQTPIWASGFTLGPSVLSIVGGPTPEGEVSTQVESFALPFDSSWERWVYGSYTAFDKGVYVAMVSMTRLEGENYVLGPHIPFAASAYLDGQSLAAGAVNADVARPLELDVPDARKGFRAYVYSIEQTSRGQSYRYVGMFRSDRTGMTIPPHVFSADLAYELDIRLGGEDETGYAHSEVAFPLSFVR